MIANVRSGPSSQPAPAPPVQYLTFWIGEEEYALGVLRVREIVQYGPVTHVPTAPPWMRGVTNLRGSVVPVVDLAVKLGRPAEPATRKTCLVIVETEIDGEPVVLGLVADAVNQVIDLAPDDIEPPPSFGTGLHPDFLFGMARMEGRFALLLDLDRVLASREPLPAVPPAAQEPGVPAAGEGAEAQPTAEAPADGAHAASGLEVEAAGDAPVEGIGTSHHGEAPAAVEPGP